MKNNQISPLMAACIALFFLTIGCNPTSDKETTEMTETEKETAKQEISSINASVIKGVNELNVDAALKGYSTDCRGVNTDGTSFDYVSLAGGFSQSFGGVKSLNFTKVKEDFKFISKTFVLCTWTGTVEPELKTGEHLKNDPHTASLLYSKINNEWKIVYEHDSESPAKVIAKK